MQGLKWFAQARLRPATARKIRAFGHLSATLAFAWVAACSKTDTPTGTTGAVSVSVGTPATVASPGVPAVVPITIVRTGGFSGDVSLTADGLPSGATAVFTPAVISSGSTSSILTISLGATSVASTGTITIRAAAAGVTTATATVSFTASVPSNPAIGLTAGSSTVSIPQGQTGTVALTLDRQGGFAGAVTVTAEGLPANVTATFNPASFGAGVTTSTLTFNVGSAALASVSNVTIRASGSGVTDKTVVVQLTITSSATLDFSLTAAPAALTVAPGAGAQSTITLARTGGFAGNVTFTTSALPAGVTATFTPNPATANTTSLAFTTTAATPAGTYTITVTGAATGQTSRTVNVMLTVSSTPGVTVALSSTAASVAAGTTTATTLTLARVGGLTGDLTVAAENLPTGVTVAFAPASPISGTSTTATFTTTAAVAPGVYTINLRATGTGGATITAPFTLTVTAAQGFSVAFTSGVVSIAVGGSGTLSANITRTGGFAGTVNLAVTGLPGGITATVNPAAAAGANATVNLTIGAGVAAGTYTGSLNGTAPGLTSTATPFSITVTGGGGGGGGNIQWAFCDVTRLPLFFAFKSGANGAWTRVLPAGNTFSFTLSDAVGGVAYVLPSGNGFATTVFLETASELQATASSECTQNPAGTKTLNGTTTGLTFSGTQQQSATVTMGNSTAQSSFIAPAFTLTSVLPGPQDLIATRTTTTISPFARVVDGIIIRRALNLADGSVITPALAFGAGGEAVAPVTATLTVNNAGADILSVISQFTSAGGTTATLGLPLVAGATTIYGVPSGSLIAGDLHKVFVTASDAGATSTRASFLFFKDMVNKSATLGPVLSVPTSSSSFNSVLRPRLQGTIQPEYQSGFGASFTQSASNRSVTVSATRSYFSTTAFDLETPDLAGVSGFNTTWGLSTGQSTAYTLSATNAPQNSAVDGTVFSFASHNGIVGVPGLRR